MSCKASCVRLQHILKFTRKPEFWKESTHGRFFCQGEQQQIYEKWGCLFWFFNDNYCYCHFDSLTMMVFIVLIGGIM